MQLKFVESRIILLAKLKKKKSSSIAKFHGKPIVLSAIHCELDFLIKINAKLPAKR